MHLSEFAQLVAGAHVPETEDVVVVRGADHVPVVREHDVVTAAEAEDRPHAVALRQIPDLCASQRSQRTRGRDVFAEGGTIKGEEKRTLRVLS